jgi:hypothetical protein
MNLATLLAEHRYDPEKNYRDGTWHCLCGWDGTFAEDSEAARDRHIVELFAETSAGDILSEAAAEMRQVFGGGRENYYSRWLEGRAREARK